MGQYANKLSLQAAAAEIQNVFGSVDYLICNASYSSRRTLLRHLGEFSENPDVLKDELELAFQVNVVGLINTINTFISLVQASSIKKIVALTSGMGDCDFVNESGIDGGAPYAISKAGVNMVVAKYNTTYKSDGVLVMGICAGSVNTHPSDARRLYHSTSVIDLLTTNFNSQQAMMISEAYKHLWAS